MMQTCSLTTEEWALVLQSLAHRRLQVTNPELKRKLEIIENRIDAVVRT